MVEIQGLLNLGRVRGTEWTKKNARKIARGGEKGNEENTKSKNVGEESKRKRDARE